MVNCLTLCSRDETKAKAQVAIANKNILTAQRQKQRMQMRQCIPKEESDVI